MSGMCGRKTRCEVLPRPGAARPALLFAVLALASLAFSAEAPKVPAQEEKAPAPSKSDPGKEARKKLLRERFLEHFAIGTCAPIEWMNETRDKNGCKWGGRVQYFSGGAAKGSWDTVFLDPWNKWVNPDKKKGVWGENFIKDTVAAGYVPWVTFYNLAQSAPAEYKPNPPEATKRNMQVVETMRAYFEQIKLLMQICARYAPSPIVVHIEPDEWGHMLLSERKPDKAMDPEWVKVKVGSTGLAEIKDLPDNLVGYAQAIKRLRDTYAPTNVLLACNPSGWDCNYSMTGEKFGQYLNKCGCNEWELAVFETGDRDKGMHGKAPPYNDQSGICGTFDRHIQWIADFHKTTGLYVVVWQVAVGNTHFAACNNTPGHHCDNIAQTLLDDYPKNNTIARYAQAGCAGFMFSPGQGDSTHVYDAKKDGVTNPAPIAGNLGNKSEYPDDDGGYLRLRVGSYSKNPYPILGKAKAPEPPPGPAVKKPDPAPPPEKKKDLSPEAVKAWDAKLLARVKEAVAAGVKPAFQLAAMRQQVKVLAVDAAGALKIGGGGLEMNMAVTALSVADRRGLARALVREDNAADHCLAAFYCFADGDSDKGEEHLSKAGPAAREVRDAFR